MVIEIIPAGSSAVVSDSHKYDRDNKAVELMEAIKDAEAQLERTVGAAYADTVKTMKDTEANLERGLCDKTMNVIQDVKDAETRLHKDAGDKFINVVQDVKDSETRLTKDLNDNFIQTIQDIKESDKAGALAAAKGDEVTLRTAYEAERSRSQSREMMTRYFHDNTRDNLKEFAETREVVKDKFENLGDKVFYGFKDVQSRADNHQLQTLLQFKEQALLSERLAAKQELLSEKLAAEAAAKAAECCCEIKEAIGRDGQKTRDLLNAITEQNLRDRAAKAEGQLAAYFARGVAPIIP